MGFNGQSHVVSGMRNSCDVIIEIDVAKAMADGFKFLKSKNNVVLMPGKGTAGLVPPGYFKNVWHKSSRTGHKHSQSQKVVSLDLTPYPYLLVLDFEANCVENGVLPCQEIIEFPIVPVDVRNLKIMNDKVFHHYVKPTVVPEITEFCTGLTGITQARVNSGIKIQEVIKNLDQWMKENGFTTNNSTFVTCGRWDLETCLNKEAAYKKIPLPDYLTKFIDVSSVFMSTLQREKSGGMLAMLQSLNIELQGKHHSGIDDSKNTAEIVLELIRRRGVFSRQQEIFVDRFRSTH